MKKFSKLLLVVLTVALLATTVFSTLGFATASEGETALIGKAQALGINRKVEDFSAEDVLIQDNVIPGEAYPESSKTNTLTWIDRDANSTNKYGVLSTIDSKSGNRYLRLMFEKAYAAAASATYKTGINISDKQTFANNDYLIYEWDMTTETQYPTNLEALFLNTNSSAVGDKVSLFSINADGTKLLAGDKEIDLGGAGAWHHFTVVISLSATGTDYRPSQGALYLDGEKIADFNPVGNKGRKHSLSLFLGYYATKRDEVGANSTVCIDNVVSTSVPVGYKTAGNDVLAPLFAADPVTDLTAIGSDVLVYNASYELPAEPALALAKADGTREFFKTFAEAYTAYKAGGYQWIELYESVEGAIDAPVVIKLSGNVTFTDTAAGTADAYPCIEATGADGSLYKTYTKSEETLTIRFFAGRKGTADAETVALEVPFGVGIIPTVPEEFAPILYSENPLDIKTVYEATDKIEIYIGEALQSEMPLVTEAMIAEQVVIDIYPVYELKDVAFDIVVTVDGATTRQYYTQNNQFTKAVEEAPDGSLVTLRKNIGADAKVDIEGKSISVDVAGKALYPAGDTAFTLFELKDGATLNLYSSVAGGVLYCGAGSAAQTMMIVSGTTASTARIGYTDDEAKDAYAGNLTIHTPTIVKASAPAAVTVANVDIKVVGANMTYGIIELSGAKCTGTLITLENTTVYNTYVENNVIAYTSSVGTNNRVVLKDTVVYAPAKTEPNGKGMINFVGTIANSTNQSVHLDGFSYFGTVSGTSVGDAGSVLLTVLGTVEATAIDRETLRTEEGTLFVNNNRVVNSTEFKYVPAGAFANSLNPVSGAKTPALMEYIAVGKTLDDFCKVTWFFYEGEGTIEEYWVRGVAPVFGGTIPVSAERITYTFEGVALDVIGETATELTIEAKEETTLELLQLKQNISIIEGMDFNLHIPAIVPVTSVTIGSTTITKDQMTLSEDGTYYIVTIGQFSLRDLATASFAFRIELTTVRSTTLTIESTASVLAYFEAIYEDETLAIIEQRMVTAFLKYAQSAGNYLGVDTSAITAVLAGKTSNYYTIAESDFVNDTGVLRSAIKGVRMTLVDVPAFVFYLRETFSGTVTVGGNTYTVENGVANGKNYIIYSPASYSALGVVFAVEINGTLAGAAVEGTGAFSLTNYLMGIREEEGSTPAYLLDLYQFFRISKLVEDMRAQEDMPY